MCKSYRSSYEITQFAQGISLNTDLIAIERHGDEPRVVVCNHKKEEKDRILHSIMEFTSLAYRTMGIICNTQKQAEELYKAIHEEAAEVHLLTTQSTSFMQGVIICSANGQRIGIRPGSRAVCRRQQLCDSDG